MSIMITGEIDSDQQIARKNLTETGADCEWPWPCQGRSGPWKGRLVTVTVGTGHKPALAVTHWTEWIASKAKVGAYSLFEYMYMYLFQFFYEDYPS